MASQPHEPYRCANGVVQATAKSGRSLRFVSLFGIRGGSSQSLDAGCRCPCPHDLMILPVPLVVYWIFQFQRYGKNLLPGLALSLQVVGDQGDVGGRASAAWLALRGGALPSAGA